MVDSAPAWWPRSTELLLLPLLLQLLLAAGSGVGVGQDLGCSENLELPRLGTAENWRVEGTPFFHLKAPDGPSGPMHEAPLGHGWLVLRGTPCCDWTAPHPVLRNTDHLSSFSCCLTMSC